jgi:hypothetical protein
MVAQITTFDHQLANPYFVRRLRKGHRSNPRVGWEGNYEKSDQNVALHMWLGIGISQ